MSWWDGLNDEFSRRMQQFVAASRGRLSIVSAYRSVETQAELWEQALRDHGPENANMWVAPPGRSNHNHGMAVDLGYETEDAMQWAHENAPKFGLEFPMEWEPWHIEPAGLRDGSFGEIPYDAYTVPPTGYLSATDPNRRADPAFAFGVINSMLLGPSSNSMLGPVSNRTLSGGSTTPQMEQQKIDVARNTGAQPTYDTFQGGSGGAP